MGDPVYIHFAFFDDKEKEKKEEEPPPSKRMAYDPTVKPYIIQSQLVVIDEYADESSSSSSWETCNSRVRRLKLPDFGNFSFPQSSFAVAGNSRLFFVGGFEDFDVFTEDLDNLGKYLFNPITYVDLNDNPMTLKKSELDEDEFGDLAGTSASKDGSKFIYGVGRGGNLFAFDSEKMNIDFNVYPDAIKNHHPILLDVSDTNKIYLNCVSDSCDSAEYLLGYFHIPSRSWCTIDSSSPSLYRLNSRVVVVEDSYIIHFDTIHPTTGLLGPFLCVYDIHHSKWLTKPVQGLVNDGYAFPYPDPEEDIAPNGELSSSSLIQLRNSGDQLKLALVWSTWHGQKRYHFHCSKFTLSYVLEDDGTPTFTAKHLSSANFFPPNTLLHVKINA